MSLKSKAKAAKKREHNRRMQIQEQATLDRNLERLKTMQGGFSLSPEPEARKKERKIYRPEPIGYRRESELESLPLGRTEVSPLLDKTKVRLSPEMQEREDRAKAVSESRKGRALPVYNKGPDIYYTDEMLKDVMSGANRRRN